METLNITDFTEFQRQDPQEVMAEISSKLREIMAEEQGCIIRPSEEVKE